MSAKRDASAPAKPGLVVRLAAAKLLGAVIDARTALDGLTDDEHGHPTYRALDARDRSLLRAILLSALRHRSQIADVLAHRLDRPLPKNARSLEHHLHVGVAQLLFLDVPDSAAVDLGVEAVASDPRTRRFAGLANALLRRIGREKDRIAGWLANNPPRPPEWLDQRLRDAYGPERAAAIAAALAHEAPLDFTVRGHARSWAEHVGGTVLSTGTVRLGSVDGPVSGMPGFAEGEWWVQDAASALPVKLFGDLTGKRALDLCAAPGGKSAQLATAGASVTAVEINANRSRRLVANLRRLGIEARIVVGDALKLERDALDAGEGFDAVLLDAPCSSTGTIRRHPDVAWTKTPDDVAKLANVQSRLLARAAEFVRPGGTLVFSNCSLLPEEGEEVTSAFLRANQDFSLAPIEWSELGDDREAVAPMIVATGPVAGTLRTTPDMLRADEPRMSGLDGFHAARFVRSV